MANSKALMLFARPTNKGITMFGNTTTSRKGSNGSSTGSEGNKEGADMCELVIKKKKT
jgi:hypothetical protein